MPWETTNNTLAKKKLALQTAELSAAKYDWLILRWKKARATFQPIYGFYGFRTWSGEKLDGTVEMNATVNEKDIVIFFPDEYRICHAILPICPRNISALAGMLLDPACPCDIEECKPDIQAKIDAEMELMREQLKEMKAAKEKKAEEAKQPEAPEPKPVQKGRKLAEMVK